MPLFAKKSSSPDPFGMPVAPGMDPNQGGPDMQGMPQQDPYGQQYYNQQPGMGDPNSLPPLNPGMQDMQQQDPYGQQQYPQGGYDMAPTFPSMGQPSYAPSGDSKERVEEIAEAIINEKWNEFIKDINKVIEWKERTDGDLKKIQQEIEDLKERFESLHRGVLGKITEYDQNLTNVGTEIKAMEMAFQKILPTFTENVNKLDRIVRTTGAKQ